MTLADDIRADVSAIFLNQNEFAETVQRYPADGSGNFGSPEDVVAIVVPDALEGTRELPGDGRTIHQQGFTAHRASITLLVPDEQEINVPTGAGKQGDMFKILNGSFAGVYVVKRVTSGDTIGFKDVLVVRPERKLTREPRREG